MKYAVPNMLVNHKNATPEFIKYLTKISFYCKAGPAIRLTHRVCLLIPRLNELVNNFFFFFFPSSPWATI